MATLVCFHAHPDDESIATGGAMAKAAADGHRVVLVIATRGEQGEPVSGVLNEGEPLWERRVQETYRSGEALGVERVEFLGYEDSGMMGEPTNENPSCFWQADVEEAAEKLAGILREVDVDVFTIYDDHGGYGHPDHIQVHRVGKRAAELADVDRVFQATMNRDQIRRAIEEGDFGGPDDAARADDEPGPPEVGDDFGSAEADITHAIDVTAFLDAKKGSMLAHQSQIAPDSFFLAMPEERFAVAFGTEWYWKLGATRADGSPFGTDLFEAVS
jgi:LmbE family N-acetylglucosaminyl deacetylase